MVIEVKTIPVDKISPNPLQPREVFDEEGIKELAESLKRFGLLQPIIVKPTDNENYQIIAGERRLRAYRLVGYKEIHAIVRDKNISLEQQMAESLIENIHREDLSPMERGKAVYQLFLSHGIKMSPKELAGKIATLSDERTLSATHAREPYKEISEVCDIISKELHTIRSWLETQAVSEDIQIIEVARPKEEQASVRTLARLSTIENEPLQKQTYEKITKGEMTDKEASKFITYIKKASEPVREAVFKPESKITSVMLGEIIKFEDTGTQEKLVKKIEGEALSEEAVKKIVDFVRDAPEVVQEAVLEAGSKVTPDIGIEIAQISNADLQKEVIKEIETSHLDEEGIKLLVEQYKLRSEMPKVDIEKWKEIAEEYEKMLSDIRAKLESPKIKERGRLFSNWLAQHTMTASLEDACCPICGSGPDNLKWACHTLTIKEAVSKALEEYKKAIKER